MDVQVASAMVEPCRRWAVNVGAVLLAQDCLQIITQTLR